MEIRLLHIYPDVMNLYGEYANVAVLKHYLEKDGHTVTADTLSLYEKRDIGSYDFYFMGAGTEKKQKLALSQLISYKEEIKKAVNDGKVLLFTGNAFDVLGKSLIDAEGNEYEALGIGDFTCAETNERTVGDCIAEIKETGEAVVGFINKCSRAEGITSPLFSLLMGMGNEEEKGDEGYRKNNLFASQVTGPLLAKNPAMLRLIAKKITKEQFKDSSAPELMVKAFEVTERELKKRLENE